MTLPSCLYSPTWIVCCSSQGNAGSLRATSWSLRRYSSHAQSGVGAGVRGGCEDFLATVDHNRDAALTAMQFSFVTTICITIIISGASMTSPSPSMGFVKLVKRADALDPGDVITCRLRHWVRERKGDTVRLEIDRATARNWSHTTAT